MMLLQIQWLLLLRILSSTVAHAVPASPSAPTKTAEKSILSCTSFTQKVTIQAGVTVLYAQTPITATKNIAHSAATSECAKLLTEAFNLYNNNKHNDNGGKYPDQTNFNFEFPQTFIQQNHLSIFSSSGRETIQTNHNSVNPSPTKVNTILFSESRGKSEEERY